MRVGVLAESGPLERRVALTPPVVPRMRARGIEVIVERGAGGAAGFRDADYAQAGARLAGSPAEVRSEARLLASVGGTDGAAEPAALRSGQAVVGLLDPLGDAERVARLAARGVTAFALELLPRISRAQPMDALTSMATISGYRAALLAASTLTRMFPLMMTAAGTVTPARVLVIGAGVAGLQAVATAKRLGAAVSAYDVRPDVAEQVESLGARFVDLGLEAVGSEDASGYARAMGEDFYARQQALLADVVSGSDVVIATAAVPGSTAPVLVTAEAVARMRPGSVVVDLAAASGGNCARSRPGERVDVGGVTILAPLNLPADLPFDASQMYARNIVSFLEHVLSDGDPPFDRSDQIARETLVCHAGDVVHARVREQLGLPPLATAAGGRE